MALIDFFGNAARDHALVFPLSVTSGYTHRYGTAYGNAWASNNTTYCIRNFTAVSHGFLGVATICSQVNTYITLLGDSGSVAHLTVVITTAAIELRRGANNGTVIASYAITNVADVWRHLQIEWTIADAGGICKVRLNDVEIISYTGDTRNGGTNTSIDQVRLGQGGNYGTSWCDFWVCDNTGSAPLNTYLGNATVAKSRPSAAGNSTQFTPDSGSNYARVNETPYSAANYVSSSTSGHKDTYVMEDLPAEVATVFAVRVGVVAKNPDGGTTAIKPVVRTGGTDYAAASGTVLASGDTTVAEIWATNPGTAAAWTKTEVNAMEAGMTRV